MADFSAKEKLAQRVSSRKTCKLMQEDFLYESPKRKKSSANTSVEKTSVADNIVPCDDISIVIMKEGKEISKEVEVPATHSKTEKPTADLESNSDSDGNKSPSQTKSMTTSKIISQYMEQGDTNNSDFTCKLCLLKVPACKATMHLMSACTKSPLKTRVAYKCSRCCLLITSYQQLQSHYRGHIERSLTFEPDACQECGKENCQGNIPIIPGYKHLPSLTCEVCNIELGTVEDFVEHKKTHWSGEYGFQCEHCAKKYRSKGDLSYHIRTTHKSVFKFNCTHCGLGLTDHKEVKEHKCPVRNPVYSAQISVTNRCKQQRIKRQVSEPQTVVIFEDKDLQFIANDCNTKFFRVPSQSDKEVKEEVGSNEIAKVETVLGGLDTLAIAASKHDQNSCEFCGKTYATASGRHKHLKVVHGYKRVAKSKGSSTCCFCDKTFSTIYYLKEHIRSVHTDDSQFECDVCQKRFRTLKDRDYHKKTVHLGEYRYYCATCGRGLHTISRLHSHKCDWGKKTAAKQEKRAAMKKQAEQEKPANQEPSICRSWSKPRKSMQLPIQLPTEEDESHTAAAGIQ